MHPSVTLDARRPQSTPPVHCSARDSKSTRLVSTSASRHPPAACNQLPGSLFRPSRQQPPCFRCLFRHKPRHRPRPPPAIPEQPVSQHRLRVRPGLVFCLSPASFARQHSTNSLNAPEHSPGNTSFSDSPPLILQNSTCVTFPQTVCPFPQMAKTPSQAPAPSHPAHICRA